MKQKRKGSVLGNIILILAIAIFVFSSYKLYQIYSEYRKGDKEYNQIVDEAVVIEPPVSGVEEKAKEHISLQIDFAKLCKTNPDMIAWIQFDQPEKISYPVVKGKDNDTYLKTTFEGKRNSAGTIFADVESQSDFSDRNTFIYGHNMKNGSMFGQLRKYKTKEFCDANPYFYIYTLDGREIQYQVFAVCIVQDNSKSYTKWFDGDEQFMDYLKHVQKISRYDTGVEVNADSQIVSLSTCTNVTDTERLLVHGVKISEK